MSHRSIAGIGSAKKRPGSYEFSAANTSAASMGRDLDPLIGIDHFTMRAPVFAPHPHAGFSAVTYLFEDSEGEFVNRDSLGHHLTARPGAVIWTVTGNGVLHDEFPRERGKRSHGLQVFVNLAAAEKMRPPQVLFVDGPDVPVFEDRGVRTRVVAGVAGDTHAKIEPPGAITFLDVKLDSEAVFVQAVPPDQSVLVYVIDGRVLVGDEGRELGAFDAATFAADGDAVFLRATVDAAQFVLIAGRPLREPVVSYGPFIMSSEEQLVSTIERYQTGDMGRLEPGNVN